MDEAKELTGYEQAFLKAMKPPPGSVLLSNIEQVLFV